MKTVGKRSQDSEKKFLKISGDPTEKCPTFMTGQFHGPGQPTYRTVRVVSQEKVNKIEAALKMAKTASTKCDPDGISVLGLDRASTQQQSAAASVGELLYSHPGEQLH